MVSEESQRQKGLSLNHFEVWAEQIWCLRESALGEAVEITKVVEGGHTFCVEYIKLIWLTEVLAGECRGLVCVSFEACN